MKVPTSEGVEPHQMVGPEGLESVLYNKYSM